MDDYRVIIKDGYASIRLVSYSVDTNEPAVYDVSPPTLVAETEEDLKELLEDIQLAFTKPVIEV